MSTASKSHLSKVKPLSIWFCRMPRFKITEGATILDTGYFPYESNIMFPLISYFPEYAILIEILFSTQDMQKKILVQLSDIFPLLLYRHLFNGASELLLAVFLLHSTLHTPHATRHTPHATRHNQCHTPTRMPPLVALAGYVESEQKIQKQSSTRNVERIKEKKLKN